MPERRNIPTPNLDRLAAEGMRFTQAYVCSSWCSPSRAGLLTGRYPQRFGHEFNPNQRGAKPTWGLDMRERTMADVLRTAGYSTAMYGKWHLGLADEMTPNARGFDEWYGFRNGEHNYLRSTDNLGPIEHNGTPIEFSGHLTEFLARQAAAFIQKNREQPFFIYAPLNEIHRPYQAPDKFRAMVESAKLEPGTKLIAASLCALDAAVGIILDAVRDAHLDERTLVVFTSDNGRPSDEHIMPWDTLRGGREQMWEGGIRVPFFARWKGAIAEGSEYHHPISHLDLMATVSVLADASPDRQRSLDGRNLAGVLKGLEKGPVREEFYFRIGETWAFRFREHKLIMPFGAKHPELYDIPNDPGESQDLALAHPEIVRQLQARYDALSKQMVAPAWPYPPGAKALLRRQ